MLENSTNKMMDSVLFELLILPNPDNPLKDQLLFLLKYLPDIPTRAQVRFRICDSWDWDFFASTSTIFYTRILKTILCSGHDKKCNVKI